MAKFKVISIIIVFLFVFCIAAFSAIPEAPNAENDDGERIGQWVLLFDEEFFEYWDEDTPDYYGLITYDNGEIDSPLKVYYPSGKLYFETQVWATDPIEIANGEVTFYWENGKLESKITYKESVKTGQCQLMNEDGNLWRKGQYVDGQSTGEWIEYYQDGSYGKGQIDQGKPISVWQYFYSDGTKQAQGGWSDGKRQQEWIYYTVDGEINVKGEYKDDIQDGDWTQYYSDNSYGVGPMSDFKKYGFWRLYTSGGRKTMSGTFVEDKQEGDWNIFDNNEQISETIKFSAGVKVGK